MVDAPTKDNHVDPLTWNIPIVDKDGRPTYEFQQKWLQQKRTNEEIPDLPDVPNDPTKFLNGAIPQEYAHVKDSDLALTDVTTNDVTTARHGFAPKAPNDDDVFLNGVAAYSVPPYPASALDDGTTFYLAMQDANGILILSGGSPIYAAEVLPVSAIPTLGYMSSALVSAHIFVGNGSNVATDVAMSGDATLSNTGVITVTGSGSVAFGTAAFTASTAYAPSALTSAQFFVGNGSNVATGVAMSGYATLANTGAVTVNKVKGVTDGSDAAAGDVGEFVSTIVAFGSAVSLTTSVAADVGSISLGAGDWDVSGNVWYDGGATTVVETINVGISTVSATLPNRGLINRVENYYGSAVPFAVSGISVNVSPFRLSLSGTTTVYLIAFSRFTISTMIAYGQITARRVR